MIAKYKIFVCKHYEIAYLIHYDNKIDHHSINFSCDCECYGSYEIIKRFVLTVIDLIYTICGCACARLKHRKYAIPLSSFIFP